MFPYRQLISILLLFLLALPLNCQEKKTEDDFSPAPLREKPLLNELPSLSKPVAGLAVSSTVALTGLGLTVANAYRSVEEGIKDPGSPEFQESLFRTGTFMISTALAAIVIDYFVDEVKKNKETISEE